MRDTEQKSDALWPSLLETPATEEELQWALNYILTENPSLDCATAEIDGLLGDTEDSRRRMELLSFVTFALKLCGSAVRCVRRVLSLPPDVLEKWSEKDV